MAGDWIAWQKGLARKPEILSVARKSRLSRREVAGALAEFWEWVDEQTENGFLPNVSIDDLESIIPGTTTEFWGHVVTENWIEVCPNGLRIPNFDRWNGESAKKRMKNTRRQQVLRSDSPVAQTARQSDDKSATTGQDRTGPNQQHHHDADELEALQQKFIERGLTQDAASSVIPSADTSLCNKVLSVFDQIRADLKRPGGALLTMLKNPSKWDIVQKDGVWTSPFDRKHPGETTDSIKARMLARRPRKDSHERQTATAEP
jgi:hypothetical protein